MCQRDWVKKMQVQNIWSRKIWPKNVRKKCGPKNLRKKIFPKKFGLKICVSIFGPLKNNFWSTNLWEQINFWSEKCFEKYFMYEKNFESEENFGPEFFFWVCKGFGSKKIMTP